MTIELTPQLREQIENTIRFLAVDAIQRADSGHPGAPMGLAGPVFELWDSQLRFDPADPDWPLRDRFVLSAGHASMLLYALLHLYGYDLTLGDVANFRQMGSKTPGHPEYGDTPGVEVTTGPLGQGLAHAVGMALAAQMTRSQFGLRDEVEGQEGPGAHFIYGVVSDGDLMEGVSSEASSLAGHLKLGNLIFLYDDNGISIDGPTDLAFSEDVRGRYKAYGWHVEEVEGQDHEGLRGALERAKRETRRPSLVIVRTVIGFGSPNRAGTSKAHGSPLGAEEVALAKRAAGWPEQPELWVPDEVRRYFAERIEAKRRDCEERRLRLSAWRNAQPERAAAWDAARERRLPGDLAERLADGMEGVDDATRKHSGAVLEKLSRLVPYMAGGSADLAGSAAPPIVRGAGIVGRPSEGEHDEFAGRNIHFGIREHAMGAAVNGMALDGTFRPYCGTFLVFSDYMRPAIRLAALMRLKTLYVFTHDSIFVGEDGPTHQPVEQLEALRAIPGLKVFRPADGVETAMAYAWILEKAEGPAVLSLTRQKLPAVGRLSGFRLRDVWRGGYSVREPKSPPDAVILASGSELGLAQSAAAGLEAAGVQVRVVSVPCLELFQEQPEEYRRLLVPDGGPLLVAVEAGLGWGYRPLVGREGLVYGIDRFGASAPAADLASFFALTPEALSKRVLEALG